jgi:hypothetical protein
MCFDIGRVYHLNVDAAPSTCKLAEQIFPNAASSPADEAVIDRCRWTICFRTIAPAASTLENMYDPADDPTIIYSFDASNIPRKMWLYPSPLLIAEPK